VKFRTKSIKSNVGVVFLEMQEVVKAKDLSAPFHTDVLIQQASFS